MLQDSKATVEHVEQQSIDKEFYNENEAEIYAKAVGGVVVKELDRKLWRVCPKSDHIVVITTITEE